MLVFLENYPVESGFRVSPLGTQRAYALPMCLLAQVAILKPQNPYFLHLQKPIFNLQKPSNSNQLLSHRSLHFHGNPRSRSQERCVFGVGTAPRRRYC
ncbi:cyclic phosphodiesterase-like [Gossypium australe]|uniref:Cyclic phosphodiesterase-like n=1 Tax=Gossypium australe TaxID=47621 RepID=A0A5B6W8Z4_9ROSI|nr:cyclic phosphodiesterase-like [Gossypium australe]